MKSTSSWEISSYQTLAFVFLETQAITGLAGPLLALTILSLESLVEIHFLNSFLQSSQWCGRRTSQDWSGSAKQRWDLQLIFPDAKTDGNWSFLWGSCKKKVEQKPRGTNDCSKPHQFSVPVTCGNIWTGPTYNGSGKSDDTNKCAGNYHGI